MELWVVIIDILMYNIAIVLHKAFVRILSSSMDVFHRQRVYLDPVERDSFQDFHFFAFHVQTKVIDVSAIQSSQD